MNYEEEISSSVFRRRLLLLLDGSRRLRTASLGRLFTIGNISPNTSSCIVAVKVLHWKAR
jgi:hypothetical protein